MSPEEGDNSLQTSVIYIQTECVVNTSLHVYFVSFFILAFMAHLNIPFLNINFLVLEHLIITLQET